MLSRVLPKGPPPKYVTWAHHVDAALVLLGGVVFLGAVVVAVAQLADTPVFPSVLRWWPATLAAAALAYTASAMWFVCRAVAHTHHRSACVVMTTLAAAKLGHALLYTAASVVFMVGLPLASVSDLFAGGRFVDAHQLPDHRRDARAAAVAAATTVWVLVAVSSAAGAVLSVVFVVRMRTTWVFPFS